MENFLKINRLSQLVVLLMMVVGTNVFAMRMTPKQMEYGKIAAKKMTNQLSKKYKAERERQYQPGKYFVYQQGTSKGVLVDQEFLDAVSTTVQNMTEHLEGKPAEIMIPLSIDAIKLVFDESADYSKVDSSQFKQAIGVVDYLEMKYNAEFPPSPVLIEVICDGANNIIKKLVELTDEIVWKRRSIEEIEKDVPDYSVFQKLDDPFLIKAINIKFFSDTNKSYLDKLYQHGTAALYLYERYGDPGHAVDRLLLQTLPSEHITTVSIIAVLNKFYKWLFFLAKGTRERKEEEAKKWFWQRKSRR